MRYYVYALYEPEVETPFYIGFSQNKQRPYNHLTEARRFIKGETIQSPNYIKLGIIKRILENNQEPVVKILFESGEKQAALDEEVRLIALYGRRCMNTGPLANITAGGEGMRDNIVHWSRGHTKETHPGLAKMSETRTGQSAWNKGLKGYGAGESNNFYGRSHSDGFKQHMSEVMKGRYVGANNHKAKRYLFIDPDGNEYEVFGEFKKFCVEHDLTPSIMRRVLATQQPMLRGKATGWLVKLNQP